MVSQRIVNLLTNVYAVKYQEVKKDWLEKKAE